MCVCMCLYAAVCAQEEALKLREVVVDSVALVEEKCSAILSDPSATSLAARCREVVQQCFKFAFEVSRQRRRGTPPNYYSPASAAGLHQITIAQPAPRDSTKLL